MKKVFSVFLMCLVFLMSTQSAWAVILTVEAPTTQLKVGEVFDFKVKIDTEGKSLAKQEFNILYDTKYTERQSLLAGDFFENVQYNPVEDGKVYVMATSTTPKTGTGTVAVLRLKLISTAPGSPNLCSVIPLDAEPTAAPQPTTAPGTGGASSLPKSGGVDRTILFSLLGILAVGMGYVLKRQLL